MWVTVENTNLWKVVLHPLPVEVHKVLLLGQPAEQDVFGRSSQKDMS